MRLKDLNNIDIKDLQNVDMDQLKENLKGRPDVLIIILMISVTVLVVITSFNKLAQVKRLSGMKITELQKKIDAADKLEITKKMHSEYLKKIPKAIAGDQLIQTLSEFAIMRDVQILSFSPAKKRSNKLVNLTSVEVNIASENYANIILFVHDIENSSYPIRIEKWIGVPMQSTAVQTQSSRGSMRTASDQEEKNLIKATITIESVELKNV